MMMHGGPPSQEVDAGEGAIEALVQIRLIVWLIISLNSLLWRPKRGTMSERRIGVASLLKRRPYKEPPDLLLRAYFWF